MPGDDRAHQTDPFVNNACFRLWTLTAKVALI